MMSRQDVRWQLLCKAPNKLEALFIQGRLQAEGIPVHIVAEPAAELYGVTHGTLALARLYVPENALEVARSILAEQPPLPPDDSDGTP